jgi:hypothetical protein
MEVSVITPLQITSASDSATNPLEGVVPPGLGRVKSFVIDNEPRTAFYTIVILNTSLISGIGSMIIKDLLLYFQCDQETPFA